MNKKPPDDPIHRALWVMGFDKKQREAIIAYCVTWARAGIAISPVEIGGAIARCRDDRQNPHR